MKIAAALAIQSIPFAALALVRSKHRDLLLVIYVSILGLLLSLIAVVDDYQGFSSLIGISVETLQ